MENVVTQNFVLQSEDEMETVERSNGYYLAKYSKQFEILAEGHWAAFLINHALNKGLPSGNVQNFLIAYQLRYKGISVETITVDIKTDLEMNTIYAECQGTLVIKTDVVDDIVNQVLEI